MTSLVLWFSIHIDFNTKPSKISAMAEQIEAKFYRIWSSKKGTKSSSTMMSRVIWFGSYYILKNKHFKIFFSRTAWQIEGKLHRHVPQVLGIRGCSQIINRSHGPAAILDWTKMFEKLFLLNRFINQFETSKLWCSSHVEYMF